MAFHIALVGNPNCGKTTFFNSLTGSTQYVGNWPGVTVEKKEGKLLGYEVDATVVDLPGIYSLSPYTPEEIVSRNYIIEEKPDLIIDIIDATNIERNMYLTTQLAELGFPMVIALNMADMLKSRGMEVDDRLLEQKLGIPVFPVSASKGTGVKEMMHKAIHILHDCAHLMLDQAGNPSCDMEELRRADEQHMLLHRAHEGLHRTPYFYHPVVKDFYEKDISLALEEIEGLLRDAGVRQHHSLRFTAVKLFEDDPITLKQVTLDRAHRQHLDHIKNAFPETKTIDRQMIIADQRYQFICGLCRQAITKKYEDGTHNLSSKIDRAVTNKYLAIPIFMLVMLAIFFITFGPVGSFFADAIDGFVNGPLLEGARSLLTSAGAAPWAVGLVCDGVIVGLGAVITFFPQIVLLFFFLSILEDSGYMSRAAFIMDKLLIKIGLSGRSFVPMLMGFGCTVPAVLATRTLENKKDKRLTVLITPFMSCSAKMPVYALFIAAFFERSKPLVIFSIYFLGILVAILTGYILNKTILKGEPAPFVMELPDYRLPTRKGLFIHVWERVKDFVMKAGTVLLAATIIIWFLQSFDTSLAMTEDSSQSLLASLGKLVTPVFAPLGFGFWEASVALLTGLAAKESIVSTFGILFASGSGAASVAAIAQHFTPLSAVSFLVFVLLYTPCIAATSAIHRELRSAKWTAFSLVFQIGIAWTVSMLVFQIGSLLGF